MTFSAGTALHGKSLVGQVVHRPFRVGIGGVGGNHDLLVDWADRRR
jgi:hypothetical protein